MKKDFFIAIFCLGTAVGLVGWFLPAKAQTVTSETVKTTVTKDSDGDGLMDNADPHPDVPEVYIVVDADRDGQVDAFEVGQGGEVSQVDYGTQLVLDHDLDALTDKAESDLFKTQVENPDTDGDGMFDGAEVISGLDPLNDKQPTVQETVTKTTDIEMQEPAWSWYVVRAAGLMAFLLLFLDMFFGLAIRTPGVKKLVAPVAACDIHCWLSLHAIFLTLVHGLGLLWDKFLKFTLVDIFVPFATQFRPLEVALGIIGLYLMIALVVTSYLRSKMPVRLWRATHTLNIFLFIGVVAHSLMLGTDLQQGFLRYFFISANIVLVGLLVFNLGFRIRLAAQRRKAPVASPSSE